MHPLFEARVQSRKRLAPANTMDTEVKHCLQRRGRPDWTERPTAPRTPLGRVSQKAKSGSREVFIALDNVGACSGWNLLSMHPVAISLDTTGRIEGPRETARERERERKEGG